MWNLGKSEDAVLFVKGLPWRDISYSFSMQTIGLSRFSDGGRSLGFFRGCTDRRSVDYGGALRHMENGVDRLSGVICSCKEVFNVHK